MVIAQILVAVTFCIINIHTQNQTQLEKAQRESIVAEEIKAETTTIKAKAQTKPKKQTTTKEVEQTKKPETTEQKKQETTTSASKNTEQSSEALYSASYFRNAGVLNWNGWRWTWYSEKVLPGGGLNIPGRHNDSDGYVCDENGYICLSSSSLDYGTVISTPLGKQGKIYDSGCAYNTIDVYVGW